MVYQTFPSQPFLLMLFPKKPTINCQVLLIRISCVHRTVGPVKNLHHVLIKFSLLYSEVLLYAKKLGPPPLSLGWYMPQSVLCSLVYQKMLMFYHPKVGRFGASKTC